MSATKGKKVAIAGATGMIGSIALRLCLEDSGVAEVIAIGRRTTGTSHPKLQEVLLEDFADCSSIANKLQDRDLMIFCLGVYTGAVPDEDFRRITVDYTIAFAEALHAQSPRAVFCLLSGAGADQEEKSRVTFARYKGMAENALLHIGFRRLHIFRPGYIYPVAPRSEPNLGYQVARWLYPVLHPIFPNSSVRSDDLANAMVRLGLEAHPTERPPVLENRDILALASSYSSA